MSDFLGDVLTPLDYVVSAPLLAWHEIFEALLPGDSGWVWTLAIVCMAVTIRVLMMPFYLRQLRVRREMRNLEPRLTELQEKFGHDRERLMQEQMKLWSSAGMNPYLSFLPLVLLGLVLFALFRIIDASEKYAPATDGSFRRGFIAENEAQSLSQARLLGARLADSFLGTSHLEGKVLVVALFVTMCVTQFVAQRQQMLSLPRDGMGDVVAKQQRFLIATTSVLFAAGGLVMPLGVLLFWATSKLWTVGQQRLLRDEPGSSP